MLSDPEARVMYDKFEKFVTQAATHTINKEGNEHRCLQQKLNHPTGGRRSSMPSRA